MPEPILLEGGTQGRSLKKLKFGGDYDEAWLQSRLFENPDSIPLHEINPAFQSLIPLCTELSTPAGPIDIVYVTPQGKLVVVELKLFKNPEARRKVIGQILDYAKELVSWSYADLQRQVSIRTGVKGNSVYKLVSQKYPEVDEAQLHDGVTQSLEKGDFMLVIAGDGIRQDAQAIVEFLDSAAQMRFTLGMIEAAVFQTEDEELTFIQPRVLLKTKEVVRQVLLTSSSSQDRSEPDEQSFTNEHYSNSDLGKWYLEFWSDFFNSLQLDDPEQEMPSPMSTADRAFNLPPGGRTAWINSYFFKTTKEIGCFVRFGSNDRGMELFESMLEIRDQINSELPFEVEWDVQDRKIKVDRRFPDSEWPLDSQADEAKKFFELTINGFVNAFRPRLLKLTKE